MKELTSNQVASFWDSSGFEMDYVGALGRSGDLLCLWDPSVFKEQESIKDRNFLLLKGSVVGCSEPLCIMNVYAPQGTREKKNLWNRIADLKDKYAGMWLLLGDFNVVRFQEERRNSNFNPVRARDFNSFIFENDLVEYAMKGGKFTFSVGNKMNSSCLLLRKSTSGIDLFDFFNSWLDRDDFEGVIRASCDKFKSTSPTYLALMKKLKLIRDDIKKWWDKTKAKEGEKEKIVKAELDKSEMELETRELSEEEDWVILESLNELTKIANFKVTDIKQKSRARWALFGDENSAFFHNFVNNRKRKKFYPRYGD
ncbi:uncharacterized protein LOC143534510 [Bidens hawaiensis]|uniref:uncharacterized protein LOC143534510 n=1 Tax=Bidens hawaiensis TaxID=980011 RepID=UPI00404AA028